MGETQEKLHLNVDIFMLMMIIDLDHLKDIEALEPSRLGEVVAEVVVVEVEADQGVHHRPGHLLV